MHQRPRHAAKRSSRSLRQTLLFVFLPCLLGCVWVWKENLHEQLSAKLLKLEKYEVVLLTERAHLRKTLLASTGFSIIDDRAHKTLGMIFPTQPPDTIWTGSEPAQNRFGIASLISITPFER